MTVNSVIFVVSVYSVPEFVVANVFEKTHNTIFRLRTPISTPAVKWPEDRSIFPRPKPFVVTLVKRKDTRMHHL